VIAVNSPQEWCEKNGLTYVDRPPLLSEILAGGKVSEEEYLASLDEESRVGWKLHDAQVHAQMKKRGEESE